MPYRDEGPFISLELVRREIKRVYYANLDWNGADDDLLAALRQGGLVAYMEHTLTPIYAAVSAVSVR